MPHPRSPRFLFASRHFRGFTLVEVVVAMGISSIVSIALVLLMTMTGKLYTSTRAQQSSLQTARIAIEKMNREIRLAKSPLTLIDANTVRFGHVGDPEGALREIRLFPGDDNDFATPWDNELYYDPDIESSGDEELIATDVAPTSVSLGIFTWTGVTTSSLEINTLEVHMRASDPFNDASIERTSIGVQGAEIHIFISARN